MTEQKPQLKLYNTITKTKETFQPKQGNTIDWYICGPTVYDSPHIGHARTYISFDIIRRVLENFFGYNVNYVMNITDVDDKIINKAREFISNEAKKADNTDNQTGNTRSNIIITDQNDNNKVNTNITNENSSFDKDRHFSVICKEITKKYESEFFEDLKALNVRPPTFVTRVTEFIEEIDAFIKELLLKGMAYKIDGSIYFDINAYKQRFAYPIFVDPSAIKNEVENNTDMGENTPKLPDTNLTYPKENVMMANDDKFINLNDGCNLKDKTQINESTNLEKTNSKINEIENKIIKNLTINKKNAADFVLWKERSSDLFYNASIGLGRPGWHIECSAMANNIFPKGLDIHSGGIDLVFPHHENEIAQSQALLDKKWVNYFIHTGHLHIDGLKMSKSLKNFITIKDFIKEYSPRQIRISYLNNKWWLPMTFSKDGMEYAVSLDNKLFTFISILKSTIKNNTEHLLNNVCFNENDRTENNKFGLFKNDVHAALCDNIDTSSVMRILFNYIDYLNPKLEKIHFGLRIAINEYFNKLLVSFGLVDVNKESNEDELNLVLNSLNNFRNDIRDSLKQKSDPKNLYDACDKIRNDLKEIGFIIEDKGSNSRIRRI
ncbi:hypothetical protein COBT_000685 [Conglomerata obtusa]